MSKPAKGSGNGLTPKQEAFALAFFETGNAAEAYRRAYGVTTEDRDSWVYVEACQLLDHPKITLRLSALQEQAERHSIYTRNKALEEYEEARKKADSLGNPSAMVSAINGKVKLFGLEAPTKSRVELSGPNGGPIQTIDPTKISSDALREILAATDATDQAEQD